jgi:hypothetical protein
MKGLAVCLAVIGVCLPQAALAAQVEQTRAVTDVELHKAPQGNVLMGQVVDPQGGMKANAPVVLFGNGQKLAETKTDRNGYFGFSNLRGGVYQVATVDGVGAYRVWAPGSAPPVAQRGALVVTGQDLVRGNWGCGRLKMWLCHPCVIAGIVAAAVAIPVAIHNADDDDEPTTP